MTTITHFDIPSSRLASVDSEMVYSSYERLLSVMEVEKTALSYDFMRSADIRPEEYVKSIIPDSRSLEQVLAGLQGVAGTAQVEHFACMLMGAFTTSLGYRRVSFKIGSSYVLKVDVQGTTPQILKLIVPFEQVSISYVEDYEQLHFYN